ncbi:MAG: EAL domain-containing protein [Candidatus Limnocylindrales bacterium]
MNDIFAASARIVVVDDQEPNRRLLERILAQAGHTSIESFADGRDALAAIAAREPDLIVLDLHMPGFDGFAVLDALRHRGSADGYLPVLVLTADAERATLSRALGNGAHDFLTKPFHAEEVVLRVRNLLETRRLHLALRARTVELSDEVLATTRNLTEAQRIAHIGSWEWDLTTGTARRSAELHRIYGVGPGTIAETAEAFHAFVHPDDRARVQASERAALNGGGHYNLEYRAVRPDGSIRLVHDEAEVVRDESGAPVRLVGTVQDVTESIAAEAERTRLVSAVEQTGEAIWMHDLDGNITYVNSSFTRVYGYEPSEIVGRHAGMMDSGRHEPAFFDALWVSVASGTTWTGSIVNRRKDGGLVEVESLISALRDPEGRLTGYVQADRDVTRERELESRLARDARERIAIGAALGRIDATSSPDEVAAAACAEIVRLPGIDFAGAIEFGPDQSRFMATSGRLARVFAPGMLVAEARARHLLDRAIGGPWLETWQARAEYGTYGDAVSGTGLQVVAFAPLKGAHGVVGVIGIGSHDPGNAERLVEYLPALATFGSIVGTLIAPELEAGHRTADERATVQEIVDGAAFRPFFQPIVDLHNGAVVGYEALSRFADGTSPDAVFALAARAGLGIELETGTLRAAVTTASSILPSAAYLSLNASPALIGSGALGPLLADVKRPLVLEVTEHVVVDDYAGLRHDLATLGPTVRLAVDDAGAGYASLRHILELAPDFVKLDIGLIRGIDADPARQALLAGMGYFAMKRKLRLVAEGIETVAELETLRSLAIPYGQGYLLGRPQDGGGPGPWPTTIELPRHH